MSTKIITGNFSSRFMVQRFLLAKVVTFTG